MKKIVEMAHDILKQYIKKDCIAVDFTAGRGYDTLFLAQQEEVKQVYSFDIQEEAIAMSKELLEGFSCKEKVCLICDGHERCASYLSAFTVGIFNFGYLPHGEQTLTTKLETSRQAVETALGLLEKQGALILTLYPGHMEGARESRWFEAWCSTLPGRCYSVLQLRLSNRPSAPYLIVIEKNREVFHDRSSRI